MRNWVQFVVDINCLPCCMYDVTGENPTGAEQRALKKGNYADKFPLNWPHNFLILPIRNC